MMGAPYELQASENNPLDMVEELVRSRQWEYVREDEDFLTIQVPGFKDKYEICLEWQDEFSSLLFACSLPVEISDKHYECAARTIEKINQNIWLGHFDLSNKGIYPTYRHTLLLRMIPSGLAVDLVHDVIELAIAECNRFFTTFQMIQAGDVQLQDNLHAAVFETVGEA